MTLYSKSMTLYAWSTRQSRYASRPSEPCCTAQEGFDAIDLDDRGTVTAEELASTLTRWAHIHMISLPVHINSYMSKPKVRAVQPKSQNGLQSQHPRLRGVGGC